MSSRASQIIIISQSLFGLSFIICLILVPHYFFSLNQGGVSNYGTEAQTKGLFVLGFAAAAVGCFLASLSLPKRTSYRTTLRIALLALGVLYTAVLVSTFGYKLSPAAARLHDQSAAVLFVAMLIAAISLRSLVRQHHEIRRAFIVFGFGFLLSALTFFGLLHILFIAQIICCASFAYLLAHGTRDLIDLKT